MSSHERAAAEAAIVSPVLDYFEGWFDGDAARVERALHPGLAKRALEQDCHATMPGWKLRRLRSGRS